MVSKNTKAARRAAATATGNGSSEAASSSTSTSPPPPDTPDSEPEVEETPESVKEEGNAAFKAGKYDDAVRLYTKAISLNPGDSTYLTNRAAAYMSLKKYRPALDDCQQASALQSESPQSKTLIRLARCQLALGLTTAATSTLNVVLSLTPKTNIRSNPKSEYAVASTLLQKAEKLDNDLQRFKEAKERKDWSMARLALDQCLSGIEGDIPVEWRLWRVELELGRKKWDDAANAANDALRLNPSSPEVLCIRGLVLFLTGRLPQALQNVQSALRLDPSHLEAQTLRKRIKEVERLKEEGNTQFKTGKWTDAVDTYAEALERIGTEEREGKGGQIRATLLSNRATTLVKLDRFDEALADTEECLELNPSSFKAFRTRARIHSALENHDQAVADFQQAINMAQKDLGTDNDVKALRSELKKAQTALKRSKTKDYYKILGVARTCTDAEIKKAYRRESLKHNPDKGGDEEKFKLVVEANATLSDPAKRERYDMGDDDDERMAGGHHGMSQDDIAELFAQFNGGGFGGGFGGGGFGGGGGGRGFPGGGRSSFHF